MKAKYASASLVNPPNSISDFGLKIRIPIPKSAFDRWRSTKAVRLFVEQEGASSSLVATAKIYYKGEKIMFENHFMEVEAMKLWTVNFS